MNIAAFLMQMVGPMVVRALISVGFTAVTFTGVRALVDQMISAAQSSWTTIPLAALQLASIAGVPDCLGLIAGAFVAKTTFWLASQSVKLVFTGKA